MKFALIAAALIATASPAAGQEALPSAAPQVVQIIVDTSASCPVGRAAEQVRRNAMSQARKEAARLISEGYAVEIINRAGYRLADVKGFTRSGAPVLMPYC